MTRLQFAIERVVESAKGIIILAGVYLLVRINSLLRKRSSATEG
jgi:hypothetical protein